MISNLNMGYCCINTKLRELGIFTSRTCRLETVRERGMSYLYELASQNIDDLCLIKISNSTMYLFSSVLKSAPRVFECYCSVENWLLCRSMSAI